MKWQVKALYLYRNNKHHKISQLYDEVFGATGSNELYIDGDGDKCWYINGKRHRKDGPAIEYSDGSKHWFLNGDLHREDGPAVDFAAHKSWYLNGKRHRKDGPAIEYANGYKSWYLNGERLTEEEFNKRIK